MKKTIVVSLIILSFTSSIMAQESTATKPLSNAEINNTPHEIGIAAGFVTGYGLSYRYWPKKMGVQLTAFPFVSSEESHISAGITGLMELDAKEWYRFFAYIGGNVNIESYDYYYYDTYPYGSQTTERIKETRYTAGFGPGIEFTPGGRIGLNIMTGFQFYYENKDNWGTLPTIEGAVFFRF